MTLKYASVCDGIGAVHVAWQPLGWQCEWTAEIEAFPAAVVEQRWGFPNRGDMTRFKEWNHGSIELLAGGTPCQSFSVAGLRKGLHDPRGGLMLTFLEIAQRYRPRWVVWENVPGVLSSNGGRDFGAFLGALGELGYGWAYRVLDAQWFGVAQRRRRVFVVGCLGDERRAAQVLFESESVRRDNPPSRAKGQGATVAASIRTKTGRSDDRGDGCDNLIQDTCGTLCAEKHPGGYTGQDAHQGRLIPQPVTFKENMSMPSWCVDKAETLQAANGCAVAFTKSKRAQSTTDDESWVPGEVSPTFNCFDQGDTRATTVVAFANRTRDGIKVPEVMKDGVTPALTNPGDGGRSDAVNVVVPQAQAFTHSGYSNKPAWITGDRTDCLPSSGHGDTSHQGIGVMQPAVVNMGGDKGGASVRTDGSCFTLSTNEPHAVCVPMAVRRLTPRECERLQGFPDDYTAIEYRKKPAADGPRYKALGNSMAVPVMAWIGKRIAALATEERMPA
jgi:DNA (cytosine-5)-methyltransferase 1